MPVFFVVVIIIADQLSKYYIKTHMELGISIPVINNVFHITYVLNPGAAFGMLKNQIVFFVVVASAMLVTAIYFYRKIPPNNKILLWAIVLLASGAAGNVIDRIQTGHVIDFFDFRIWPVFNLADCAIVLGISLMFYSLIVTNAYHRKDD